MENEKVNEVESSKTRSGPKILLRAVCFVLVGVILLLAVQSVLIPKYLMGSNYPLGECLKELHELEEDTVQVFFMGSSHMYHGVSPMRLYEQYGLTSFILGAEGMPMAVSYYTLKDALKTQNPEVVVLDVSSLLKKSSDTTPKWEIALYTTHLHSEYRGDLIKAFLSRSDNENKNSKQLREDAIGAYFPLYKVHSRWSSLEYKDFMLMGADTPYRGYKGYLMSAGIVPSVINLGGMNRVASEMQKEPWTDTTVFENGQRSDIMEDAPMIYNAEIDGPSLEWLLQIQKLCDENGIRLLTVKIPVLNNPVSYDASWTMQRYDRMMEIASEYNLDYLELLYGVDMQIDWSKDTHDGGQHFNLRGAEKVTDYLGSYLMEAYGLEAKPSDDYDRDLPQYQMVAETAHLQMERDFGNFIRMLDNSGRDLTVFMAVCSDMSEGLIPAAIDILHSIGLQSDFASMDYSDTFLAVWEHSADGENRIPYEAVSNRTLKYEYDGLPNGKIVKMMSKGGYEYADVYIKINEIGYAPRSAGLWFVVYDHDADEVIDSAGFHFPESYDATCPLNSKLLRNYEASILDVAFSK